MAGTQRPRTFILNGQEIPDPDPTKTPGEVRDMYSGQYPELTTANPVLTKKDGVDVWEFKKSAGTKG